MQSAHVVGKECVYDDLRSSGYEARQAMSMARATPLFRSQYFFLFQCFTGIRTTRQVNASFVLIRLRAISI